MNLQQRAALLTKLGEYMVSDHEDWLNVRMLAERKNPWFTQEFINLSVNNIVTAFLQPHLLKAWTDSYAVPEENKKSATVGIVMAGNIPLVGFHDFLCAFIAGNKARIKLSSKDEELLKHLVNKMAAWNDQIHSLVSLDEMLKGCDAYIATGSNNSGRYFEYYFSRYPNIIRCNRTSVAILTGRENDAQLNALADDVHTYFGLGCRNVTHLFVPEDYDFEPLINVFKKYNYFFDMHKYKNNYDYQLALMLMNKVAYMSTGSLILRESSDLFSPIGVLNYSRYDNENFIEQLRADESIQCIVGGNTVPFGGSQTPQLNDYADGTDTMQFLLNL
ncbi:acyl-CoA reductase [Haoranjiania flava]|uniref:Acyl-CoA reductase n=1 Tax=Haoranjiania flava TaxID=1856322 RepID=A0AAE3IJF8_9BACT|nr:acyl-CoA reductase [Haoranjiania flava]MCU7693115.1 acyl-CoA reductase [Haoranjiania flava]